MGGPAASVDQRRHVFERRKPIGEMKGDSGRFDCRQQHQRKAQRQDIEYDDPHASPAQHRSRKNQQEDSECQTQNRDPRAEVEPTRHEPNSDRAERDCQCDDQSGGREIGYST
jgi:hypothetical protein